MQTICLIGASGRMGLAIKALLSGTVHLFTRLNSENNDALIDAVHRSDLVIDFSNHENLEFALNACLINNKPYLCGTTGFALKHFELLKTASKHIPIFYADNTSYGIAILKKAVAFIAESFGANSDIVISETHHNLKKDAPSGTALAIGELINKTAKYQPSYSSIRGGNVVGEHTVHFFHKDEIIRISHESLNRNVFADGAVRAAIWLTKQQPGFYGMNDLLELKT